jgi:hypothetical protein
LDPRDDAALEGFLWWVSSLTNGEIQLYYSRIMQERTVMVLYLTDISADPENTYALFARLVLSGRFNSVMSPFGVSMPNFLDGRATITLQ